MNQEPANPLPSPGEPNPITSMSLVFEGGLAAVAIGLGWLLATPPLATIHQGGMPAGAAALCGVAGVLPMLAMLAVLENVSWKPIAGLRTVVDRQVTPLFTPMSVAELALISLAAGCGEEMLFRGVLQLAPVAWLPAPWGMVTGIVASSILFGACHWVTRTYAIIAGLMGVYFGLLLLVTGNILTPLVAHALYDFIALLYLTRSSHREPAP